MSKRANLIGRPLPLSEISKLTGINYRTLYMRYRRTGDIGC